MAFNLGYVELCDRNIQHIYTTTDIRQPAKRKKRTYKPEFLEEQARKIREKELNRRYMEYIPQHDIELPKAPAFRTLEKRYVDTVVDRLTRPARERFNFKYPEHDVYNDWRKVERDRKQKLKDILDKLDGKTPKGKRKKKKMTEDSENAIIVNANPDEPDFVSSLPPIKD